MGVSICHLNLLQKALQKLKIIYQVDIDLALWKPTRNLKHSKERISPIHKEEAEIRHGLQVYIIAFIIIYSRISKWNNQKHPKPKYSFKLFYMLAIFHHNGNLSASQNLENLTRWPIRLNILSKIVEKLPLLQVIPMIESNNSGSGRLNFHRDFQYVMKKVKKGNVRVIMSQRDHLMEIKYRVGKTETTFAIPTIKKKHYLNLNTKLRMARCYILLVLLRMDVDWSSHKEIKILRFVDGLNMERTANFEKTEEGSWDY